MRQLLWLSTMLLFVLVLMSRARDPRMWTWLTNLDSLSSTRPVSSETTGPMIVEEELVSDAFVASAGSSPAVEKNEVESPDPERASPTPVVRIDASVFDGIGDKTRSIPPRAYFHLLEVARRTPDEVLEQQARRDVTFAQFAANPKLYRGEPVSLKGHVRRMTEFTPVTNREGFDRLYEGWLFTEESQDNPYVIIISRLPQDFPLGGSIVEDVSFAGYFLKLWAYRAGDGDRYAPLLLGHRIVWRVRPSAFAPSATLHAILALVVAGLIAGLFAVTWYTRRGSRAIRRITPSRADDRPDPHQVHAMGEMAAPSTEEYLANMERQSEADAPRNVRDC